MVFLTLAFSAPFLTIIKIIFRVSFVPLLFRNKISLNPFFPSARIAKYRRIDSLPIRPMGTNLSLFPLPTTLIRPSSKNKSEHRRLTSSLTRKPQEYSISSMAVFRTSMGRSSSKLLISFSTSDVDKAVSYTHLTLPTILLV